MSMNHANNLISEQEQEELERLQEDPAEEPGDCYGLEGICRNEGISIEINH